MDTHSVDPQLLCSKKSAAVSSKVGPFGLLIFATKDLTEHTAVFFRIFRDRNRYVVLMCSDQSRFVFEHPFSDIQTTQQSDFINANSKNAQVYSSTTGLL